VEIYQNCNIYNDGAFELLKSPDTKDEALLRLEHDKPLLLGADGHRGVVRRPDSTLALADVAEVGEDAILVHDAHADDPSVAFALSRLGAGSLNPTAVGVFRDVDAPCYDDLMARQLEQAAAANSDVTRDPLATLLAGSDTWTVG
jgi:2-oxoglutarate ferredoxin oxidoreductase subunit beta